MKKQDKVLAATSTLIHVLVWALKRKGNRDSNVLHRCVCVNETSLKRCFLYQGSSKKNFFKKWTFYQSDQACVEYKIFDQSLKCF